MEKYSYDLFHGLYLQSDDVNIIIVEDKIEEGFDYSYRKMRSKIIVSI